MPDKRAGSDFTGRVALVTGAARGLGRAAAERLHALGASVAVNVRDVERAEALATAIGPRAVAVAGDVSAPGMPDDIVRRTLHAFGRVDILVNNAGGVLGQVGRPLESVSPEEWQSIFDVNVSGAFYCSQAVAPGMKAARGGRIINISSGAGLGISLTGIQAYASAKAAQIGLTRQLAHELGAWGITVNNIAPGFVRSNPATERQWESYGEEGQRALVDRIALKRLGTPDDIAYGVLFFASDHAGWITGQVLSIDGGK